MSHRVICPPSQTRCAPPNVQDPVIVRAKHGDNRWGLKTTSCHPLFTAHLLKLMLCFPVAVPIRDTDFQPVADSALSRRDGREDGEIVGVGRAG